MNKILGIMGVVGLLFAGCSSEDDILSSFHNDPNAVHITAEVGKASADGFTRSNPLGDAQKQKEFNQNDEISVKADGQEAVTYKFNGTEWQPQDSKFLKWESNEMNFTAYYPATFNGTITQPTEYNNEADLAAADFMSFSGPKTNTNDNKRNQLTLTMERKMARVVVEIASFNDQYTKNATVNSLSISGVKAFKHENKFYALIDPNYTPSTTAPFLSLEVVDGESKATEKYTTTPTAFVAGKSYTYKLTVGKNKISVSGITVADWDTGKITDNGKAEPFSPYVTFTADAEQTFKMTTYGDYTISGLQYSVNNGKWQNVVVDKEVTFGGTNSTLRLRGTNINGTAYHWIKKYSTITFTDKNVKVACTGDIRTLLNWKYYDTVDTQNARFCNLFDRCSVLTSAPELPATTLADNCYNAMFEGCTSLKSAPKLPATTLAVGCYSNMFSDCTSLTSAPTLPATTLANYCYIGMFISCTSLTSAPTLSATTLADYCYSEMFNGCTNLSSVKMLASKDQITSKDACCEDWLKDAGTGAKSRTLNVKNQAAYNALKDNSYLPADYWQIGKCTVLAEDNSTITE